MRESHAHIDLIGESLALTSVGECTSVAEVLDAVRREAERVEKGESPWGHWVRMRGLHRGRLAEKRWPTREELDEATRGLRGGRGGPCALLAFDYHSVVANSAALAETGLKAGDRVPPNGLVCVDERTGGASGFLIEQAAYKVWDAAPAPVGVERRGFVLAGLRHLASFGYTEAHDMFSEEWLGPVLGELDRAGELAKLGMSVKMYAPVKRLEAIAAGRHAWQNGRVWLAGGKIFADGTLGSRTAWMLGEYPEPVAGMPRGKAMVSEAELDAAVALTASLGLELAVHAIGDAAVRMVLDAKERYDHIEADKFQARVRIEHAAVVAEEDVPRFAELGVACSVQPCHLPGDASFIERLPAGTADRFQPLRELIDAGCVPGRGWLNDPRDERSGLWFGSDAPIVGADPDDSVHAATQRRKRSKPQNEALGWEQRISEDEAWAAFGR